MIIHIWMHWFWITTAYFKGFLLFTAQTISFSCISLSCIAEAGLLDLETFTPVTPDSYNENSTNQIGQDSNITVPTNIDEGNQSSRTMDEKLSLAGPQKENSEGGWTVPELENTQRTVFDSTSDVEDTYNGGTLDVFQYPLKKFTKYSHLKYGKLKTKGKASEETEEEERKSESVKIMEEKVNISHSVGDSETGHLGQEVDKSNENLPKGYTSEILISDSPDLVTTTLAIENVTPEKGNESLGYFSKFEEDVTVTSSTKMPQISLTPIENQKEMEVLKNQTLVIESKVEESGIFTTEESFIVKNRVAASTSAHNFEVEQSEMNAGSITGITLGILVVFSLFGAVSFVFYRRRYLNKPQVLHDKCSNLDSSGYIDETSLRENSEEMYSLDNDSFLNSLEAMTIQNYWTENVKHTKL